MTEGLSEQDQRLEHLADFVAGLAGRLHLAELLLVELIKLVDTEQRREIFSTLELTPFTLNSIEYGHFDVRRVKNLQDMLNMELQKTERATLEQMIQQLRSLFKADLDDDDEEGWVSTP